MSMLSVSHALTGALIATKASHPLLYIPLTFMSHYLEDWIPHWDVGTGLSSGKRKRKTAIVMEFVELGLTVVLVYAFWRNFDSRTMMLAAAGAFVGLIPDFLEAPRNFLKWEPWFLKPINKLHGWFHHSTHNIVLGLLPQLFVVILVYFLR